MTRAFPLMLTFLFAILFVVEAKPRHASSTYARTDQKWISEDLSEVFFLLYTRSGGVANPTTLPKEFDSLTETDLDRDRPTFFIMHGFSSGQDFGERFVPDLLEIGDYNVITINWPTLASWTNYFKAAENVVRVGEYSGEFVADLITKENLQLTQTHFIGHSLGAHGMAHLGRNLRQLTGLSCPRITGLDPAHPWFSWQDPSVHLNNEDADFVDIIHTNSGSMIHGCLSYFEPLGHVDFYPAGGVHQPGCTDICVGPDSCAEFAFGDLIKGGCSHDRSVQYFIESINSPVKFESVKCSTYDTFEAGGCDGQPEAEMGFHLKKTVSEGSYFLEVNEEEPFAQG